MTYKHNDRIAEGITTVGQLKQRLEEFELDAPIIIRGCYASTASKLDVSCESYNVIVCPKCKQIQSSKACVLLTDLNTG